MPLVPGGRYFHYEKSTEQQKNGGERLETHEQNDQVNGLWTWDAPQTIYCV